MKLKYYLRTLGLAVMVTAFLMGVGADKNASMSDAQIRERALQLGMVDPSSFSLAHLQSGRQPEETPEAESETVPEEETIEEPIKEPIEESIEEPGAGEEIQEPESAQEAQEPGEEPFEGSPSGEETPEGSSPEEVLPEEPSSEEAVSEETVSEETVSEEASSGEGSSEEEAPGQEVSEETPGTDTSAEIVVITIRGGDSSTTVSRRLAEAGLVADAAAYDEFLCGRGYDKRLSVGTYEIPRGSSEEEIAKIITKSQ